MFGKLHLMIFCISGTSKISFIFQFLVLSLIDCKKCVLVDFSPVKIIDLVRNFKRDKFCSSIVISNKDFKILQIKQIDFAEKDEN